MTRIVFQLKKVLQHGTGSSPIFNGAIVRKPAQCVHHANENIGLGTLLYPSVAYSSVHKAPLSHIMIRPAIGANSARKCCIVFSETTVLSTEKTNFL